VITGKTNATKFYITSPTKQDTFYTGSLSPEKQSQYSAAITRIADFSALKRKGSYVVFVPGIGNSYSFRIADTIYKNLAKAVLKAYYYMRSDMELEAAYAGRWKRHAGHPCIC